MIIVLFRLFRGIIKPWKVDRKSSKKINTMSKEELIDMIIEKEKNEAQLAWYTEQLEQGAIQQFKWKVTKQTAEPF